MLLAGLTGQFLDVDFAPMAKATTLFEDGFESNDFLEWTGTSGSPSIVGDPVKYGSYAASFDAVEYCYETLSSSQPVIYHRFYFRVT